jgi:hypothetical protein
MAGIMASRAGRPLLRPPAEAESCRSPSRPIGFFKRHRSATLHRGARRRRRATYPPFLRPPMLRQLRLHAARRPWQLTTVDLGLNHSPAHRSLSQVQVPRAPRVTGNGTKGTGMPITI